MLYAPGINKPFPLVVLGNAHANYKNFSCNCY